MRRATASTRVRRGTRAVSKASRNRRRPNYKLYFFLFCLSALVSTSVTYALKTPNLDVTEVSIKGIRLSDSEVVGKYANSVIDKNIILMRKSPIRSTILALNEVRDVRIGRKYPNKVWVRVIEREPDAILTDGVDYCMVQDDGLMFHRVTEPIRGIPLIKISNCEPIRLGKLANSSNVQCALEIVKLARNKKLKVDKISVDHDEDICLNMGGGYYVKLGQPDDTARKISLLKSALVYRPSIAQDAIYIDLSCPSAPVWKPKVVARNTF